MEGRDMVHDEDSELDEIFPLPPEVRLHKCRFGSSSVSPLVPLPKTGGPERPPITLRHADPKLGVTVELREVQETGHLMTHAFCTDPAMLKNGAVSAVLYGPVEQRLLSRRIPLDVPEENGCSGSADFGKLSAVADAVGAQVGVVVFLLT